jgi:hypothetical protein
MVNNKKWQSVGLECRYCKGNQVFSQRKKQYLVHGIYVDQDRFCTVVNCVTYNCPLNKNEKRLNGKKEIGEK